MPNMLSVLVYGKLTGLLIRSTWSASIVGPGVTVQITGETFKGLGQLVWNRSPGFSRQFSPE